MLERLLLWRQFRRHDDGSPPNRHPSLEGLGDSELDISSYGQQLPKLQVARDLIEGAPIWNELVRRPITEIERQRNMQLTTPRLKLDLVSKLQCRLVHDNARGVIIFEDEMEHTLVLVVILCVDPKGSIQIRARARVCSVPMADGRRCIRDGGWGGQGPVAQVVRGVYRIVMKRR